MTARTTVLTHTDRPALGGQHKEARLALRQWWTDEGNQPVCCYMHNLIGVLMERRTADLPLLLDLRALVEHRSSRLAESLSQGQESKEKLQQLNKAYPKAKFMLQWAFLLYTRLLAQLPKLQEELVTSFYATDSLHMEGLLLQSLPGNATGSSFGPDCQTLLTLCEKRNNAPSVADLECLSNACDHDYFGWFSPAGVPVVDDQNHVSVSKSALKQVATVLDSRAPLVQQVLTVAALANLTAYSYVPRPFNAWSGIRGGIYTYVPLLEVIEKGRAL